MEKHFLTSKEFIEIVFIRETEKLIQQELHHFAFLIMAQGIETLGSFLDTKPLKAQSQSKLRFSHAINRLMPLPYRKLNQDHWLYDKLRASLAHTFVPSSLLILSNRKDEIYGNRHLTNENERVILVAEDFYHDFKKACLRLLKGMEEGYVPEKKINQKFYYPF